MFKTSRFGYIHIPICFLSQNQNKKSIRYVFIAFFFFFLSMKNEIDFQESNISNNSISMERIKIMWQIEMIEVFFLYC